MAQMADRSIKLRHDYATVPCLHWKDWMAPVEAHPRTLYLYRYRLDFDELNLHLQGLAQLCPDCLTLYYSQTQVLPQRSTG